MDRSPSSLRWRRTRQRAAHRRRDSAAARRPFGPVLLDRLGDLDPRVRAVVNEFVDRAVTYPWILGCFLEPRDCGHRLILHVPRPMTRAIACLARTWVEELRARRNGPGVEVAVSAREPKGPEAMRTVFRR